MRKFHWVAVSWLGLCALAGPAQAQVDTMSLNFGKVEFEYRAARTGGVPFALDLVVGEQGSADLRLGSGQSLRFRQGQFHPVEPLAQSWLGFEVGGRMGALGQLMIGIDQSGTAASAGGGPHVRILDGSTGEVAAAHAGGAHVLMGDGSVRFITDSVETTLQGAPASLFNRPGPGEPLEARLPTPQPGQTIELLLKIWDDRGASTQMPVRISRAQ